MGKEKPNKKSLEAKKEDTQNVVKKNDQNGDIWQDARFQHLVSDPRFKGLPKAQRKVKIDKRFQGMFTDNKFKVKYTVDKYGRKVNKTNAEDLKKYYELDSSASSSDENEDQEEAERRKEEKAISRETANKEQEESACDAENDLLIDDGEEVPKSLKEQLLDPTVDYARGEGRLITDSSDDESSDEENDPETYIDHVWGELDNDAEVTEKSTNRLAVCNMDWDRIRAMDLMVLFSSFLPPGGSVLSVKIYPSEFGKERLAEEDEHGPPELIGMGKEISKTSKAADTGSSDDEDELVKEQDSDAEEGDEYHMEKLRQYQLNRLRYYYAVVECDSVETADKIYQECDGIEYESSATRVDLRFIPDDTSFDEDEPTDICTDLPDTNSYKPRQFTTTALQQAKVELTWDETAVERRELGDKLTSGKLEDVSDKDIRKIVAYSSEEEDDEELDKSQKDEEEREGGESEADVANAKTENTKKEKSKSKKEDVIAKYKALLAEINEKEEKEKNNKYEMEYTWDVTATNDQETKDDKDSEAKANQNLTPIEKVLQKRSEKNKKRKEERKKKKLQARGLHPDEMNSNFDSESVPDDIDMHDPYFAEEFQNGDFEDPAAKKKEKKKKLKNKLEKDEEEEERQSKELQLLLDDDDANEQGKQHFSLEKILKAEQETKSKRKRRKQLKKSKSAIADERKELEDNFEVDINDTRFNAIYSSHMYNIDPTDSHFKKTKGMEKIIKEKLKRRNESDRNETATTPEIKRPKKQLQNALLVKSLKRKIQLKQQQ